MTFQIKIQLGNDAMLTGNDVKIGVMRCIHNLDNEILDKEWEKTIYDENGNRVGNAWCEE